MKKTVGIITSAATYLTLAPFAFAETINLCEGGGISQTLCELKAGDFGKIIGVIINTAFILAIVAALGYLIYGGIRWVTSGGDKGKVEAARSHIVAAIIGLIVVFLSYLIISIILSVFGLPSINNLELPTL